MSNMSIIKEQQPTRLSVEFGSEQEARVAMSSLTRAAGFGQDQIQLIAPSKPDLDKKLAPENRAMGNTVAAAHMLLAVGWLLLGLAFAWLLINFGPGVTRVSPLVTYVVLMLGFPMIGLLMAGVLTLRPQQNRLVHVSTTAKNSGKWIVIVQCADPEQRARAELAMEPTAQIS